MQNTKVSIVIPTYGRAHFLKDLISSVRNSTPQNAYEFVIVSSDLPESDKVKWLLQQRDVELILAGQRKKWQLRKQSLYYYINLGIKKTKKEWVFAVNDDMCFDKNWYKELEILLSNPINNSAGMVIVATHIGSTKLGRRIVKIGKTQKNGVWKDLYLSDLSIIKKSVLEDIGFFDENLEWYGSGADNSLSIEFMTNENTLISEKIIVDHFITKENRNADTESAFTDLHYLIRKWDKWCKENNCQYICDFGVEPYTFKNILRHHLKRKLKIIKHYVKYILKK